MVILGQIFILLALLFVGAVFGFFIAKASDRFATDYSKFDKDRMRFVTEYDDLGRPVSWETDVEYNSRRRTLH